MSGKTVRMRLGRRTRAEKLTFSGIPFHGVLRSDTSELGLDDVGAGSIAEGARVGGRTPELLAVSDKLGVQAGASGWFRGGSSGRCSGPA
jgi:hypothetical protein